MLMLPSTPKIQDRPPMTCVLDPALVLSQHGVALVKCLGSVMELWVVRELWHILNDTTFYMTQPQLIAPRDTLSERTREQECHTLEEIVRSLKEWEKFRVETDLTGLNLFWFGDSPRESYLPKNRHPDIFWQWESIVSCLDRQLNPLHTTEYMLPLVFRDTTALVAALGSATILTYQTPVEYEHNLPPAICKELENWDISCQALTDRDSIVAMERTYLHDLIIQTDSAKFLWAGIHLTILHLFLPAALQESQQIPWSKAKGFWYSI
jgi:hypothetical protein